jgi:hypothetical protein
MCDKDRIKGYEATVHEVLTKIEDTLYLLKDGKQILANNKLNGIKQKLVFMYKEMKELNEDNKNS